MDNKIEYAICAHGMDKAYGKVIIGFSGGADSSLLLHYFSKKAEKVVCVHVNHMIRGEEADRDEEFCKNVCEKYGVELPIISAVNDIVNNKANPADVVEALMTREYKIENN